MTALRTLLSCFAAVALAQPAAAQSPAAPPGFTIVAKDGRLDPARLEVPSGQRIKLIVRNDGSSPIEFENLDLRVEKVLAPGATSFVVLPKLKPGEYEFIDEFHPATAKMKLVAK